MREYIRSENGSASVEFIALALPLFIPIVIFLQQFSSASAEENFARTLAREGARAYVSSSSEESAEEMMRKVIFAGGVKLGLNSQQTNRMGISLRCSSTPCRKPNEKVEVTVSFKAISHFRSVSASAQEYFSPWI